MADRTERDIMNLLIETCRDGARGFQLAADHVGTPELKTYLTDTARQREAFATELVPIAQRLGGGTDAPGTTRGAIHRGWMKVKDAMTNYDEDLVLAEAVRGEAVAANVYAEAVMSFLPPGARPIIERQYEAVRGVQHDLDEFRIARLAS
jgi:uncharacterized protein (TIGR02284 family)